MKNINCKQVKDFLNKENHVNINNIRNLFKEKGIKHVSYLGEIRQASYKEFFELSDETKKLINTWRRVIGNRNYDSNINKISYPKSNLDFELLNSLEQTYNRCTLFGCNDELNTKYKPFNKINEFKTLFETGDIDTFFSNKMKLLQYEVDEIIRTCNGESVTVKPKSIDSIVDLNIGLIEFTANDVFEVLSIIVKDIEKCELKLGKLYVRKTYDRSDSFYIKLDIDIDNTLKKLHKLYSEAKYQIYRFERIYNGDPNGRFYINDKTVAVNGLIETKFNDLIINDDEHIKRFECEVSKLNVDVNQINFELLSKFSKLQSKLDNQSFNEIKELIYKNIYKLP